MRVLVDGVRLFFDIDGAKLVPDGPTMRERPTLLLLHGGPGFDHSLFKPAFSSFADEFQVVYLDHRGNGRSDPGTADPSRLDRWADDVRAFCDAVQIERPIVLGVSFGGIVAQAYAVRHPEHPRALVLCSTTAKVRRERVLAAFERLGGTDARQTAAAWLDRPSAETAADYMRLCLPLYSRQAADPEPMQRVVLNLEVTMRFFAGEWRTFDFLPVLNRVRCPTLVLGGDADPITPIEDGEDLAAALPPSLVRFERFSGCGHPVFKDDEAGCFRAVREFLANL